MYKFHFNKIIILLFILVSSVFGESNVNLFGSITKIFNDGTRERFSNQKIILKKFPQIYTRTYSKGNFSFTKEGFPQIGEKIQLKISDPNWFILSPFNGILFVPKKDKRIDILVIPKTSTIYLTLFAKKDYHTIQVLSVVNEKSAIAMTNNLKRYCINTIRKGTKYCNKYTYYTSYFRNNIPNNGYLYKVNFGKYEKRVYAEKDKNSINRKYSVHGIIKTYIKIVEK